MKRKDIHYNTNLFLVAAEKNGARLRFIDDTPITVASLNGHKELLFDISSSCSSFTSGWIASDKFYTKKVLEMNKINVAPGKVFSIYQKREALKFADEVAYPVVVKPVNDGQGNFVYSLIESPTELSTCIDRYAKENHSSSVFLLEKHIFGEEYRVLITKTGYFAAVHRTPARVLGDGKHSIKQLIEAENFRRMNPRITCLCEIKMDEVVSTFLAKNQQNLQSVPAQGAVVQLRPNTNVSKGGGCEDITNRAHPSVKKLASRVLDAVGGLAYVGLDLICQDISKPLTKQEWIICELNAYPGLSLHTVPGKGQSHDVAKPLVEVSFNV